MLSDAQQGQHKYNNFLTDMLTETQECVNIARKAGIKDERIILDPGVGFGKTYEMNLETMNPSGAFSAISDSRYFSALPVNP